MSSQNAEPSPGPETPTAPAGGSERARTQVQPADAPEEGLESRVAAYLRAHPDFFERNPEVLGELRLSHATGGAVSLIEHQVNVLRRQLDTERSRLSHLISRAREYESLSSRLHGLVLQLIPASGLEQLQAALEDALSREFSAEAVTLKLFPIHPGGEGPADTLTQEFLEFVDREHALCGPLGEDKTQILFGAPGSEVRCAALVPIRAAGRSGVLAIGAADPERFRPDMGTDLLDRLGEIVGCKLGSLDAAPVVPPAPAQAAPGVLSASPQDQDA
ncbi:MAG: DUF484 family protein [Bdellovibrio bacteriovorus]